MAAPVRTRLATRADIPSIAALVAAMDAHYGTPDSLSPAETASWLMAAGFPDGVGFTIILGESKRGEAWVPAGMATLASLWPTSRSRAAFFVKDLFVLDTCRGGGVGRHLMAHVASLAAERGLSRVDWTADPDAEATLGFHDSLGARRMPKVFYRLDGEALKALAAETRES